MKARVVKPGVRHAFLCTKDPSHFCEGHKIIIDLSCPCGDQVFVDRGKSNSCPLSDIGSICGQMLGLIVGNCDFAIAQMP